MAASRNKPPIDLKQRVADFLATRLSADEPLCIGLSGGCDSVVLLHLLSRLTSPRPLQAIHVHHGLSPNADAWAEFCCQYADQLGVSCTVVRVAVDRNSGLGLEAAARQARYAVFSASGFNNFFLAHHAGDQAETLLFNLLRGSGVSGLAAMPFERTIDHVHFFRPLLACSRETIEQYAVNENLKWIDDESNADTRFSRNFIRHDLMPVIKGRFPEAEQTLFQASSNCAEADVLLGELAGIDWERLAEQGAINMRRLRTLSLLRLKNLLRYRLRRLGWRLPDASRLDEFARQLLESAPDRHPQLDLPDGRMRVEQGALYWLTRNKLLPAG